METVLRIGELALRTGASAHALRVWENRYQLVTPQRTANGYRLYTTEDEQRVREMMRLRAQGVAAAVAAERVLDTALGRGRPQDLEALLVDLRSAFASYDDATAHTIIDAALAGHPIERVLEEFVFPCLRRLGEDWEAGVLTVADEHYASGLIRGRLLALAPDLGREPAALATDARPSAVLACTPHQHHDIALLALSLMLRLAGWQVTFLGADTPVQDSASLAGDLGADVLVLCGTEPHMFAAQLEQFADVLASVRTGRTLALAGPAATPALADRHCSTLLQPDPAAAAAALAAAHRRMPVPGGRPH
ncbi:MAG: MerR family transcriptional regulator [Actinomycetota bacterium]|nr:MerR family transcriptional regulator [Actinomycetota bacterium]